MANLPFSQLPLPCFIVAAVEPFFVIVHHCRVVTVTVAIRVCATVLFFWPVDSDAGPGERPLGAPRRDGCVCCVFAASLSATNALRNYDPNY